MKKVLFWCWLSALVFGMLSCASISPKVSTFLGTEILDIVMNAETVESYTVEKEKKNTGTLLGGFPIIKQGPNLSSKQVKQLRSIIADPATYDFKTSKRCPLLPEYGFKFIKGEKSVALLVCYSCDIFSFQYEGMEKIEDFDSARKTMEGLTTELFQ